MVFSTKPAQVAELAEEPVLHRVPFRGPRRIVAHRDFQSGLIREPLEPLLVLSRPGAVAAARIRLDHQACCVRIVLPVVLPPVLKGIGREIGNVLGRRDAHVACVSFRIIDPVGHGDRLGVRTEVVIVDLLALATPRLPGVFELADQFLFLRVDADPRVAGCTEILAFFSNVAKLFVPFLMFLPGVQHLAMAAQTDLLIPQ